MTDPSCIPAHLPSQTASTASGSPFLRPATQPPPTRHSSQTPARDAPPGGFGCPKPGPFSHGQPRPRETDQLLSPRGKVTAPLRGRGRPATRPPAGPGRRPSSPSCPRPAPGQDWPGRRLGGGEAGGPSRPAATPPPGPHPGSRTSCGVSAAPTAAHPDRDSLASERPLSARGPGEVAGGRGRGRAPSTASASSTRQGGERGEHNSPRLAPAAAAAARARRRLSLGGGHYARARARRAALPVAPAPACSSPPTRLPAAAAPRVPPLLARLRPFRSRGPMAARPYYISARGRGQAATAAPARRELQGTSPSVPGAPPLPRALSRRLLPALGAA